MGGRGSSSGAAARGGGGGISSGDKGGKLLNNLLSNVNNPSTKQDYILKLKVIAEHGENGYNTEVSISDWEKNGKSRTYLKINAYREGDGKFHHSKDYGYFDNKSNSYESSKGYGGLDGKTYSVNGSSMSDIDIKSALQRLSAKREI